MSRAELSLFELRQLLEFELEKALNRPIAESDFQSKRLNESIRYATLSSGKRLRPLLVLATALADSHKTPSSYAIKLAMPAAVAVELIHTYSLVHDDLPAMDDDDFRRGRPSLHRQFDEGLAILAGDALLADAFLFASSAKHNAAVICHDLALMAGSRGLVAGQAEDLRRDHDHIDLKRSLLINQAKTARLFETCAVMGMLAVDAPKQSLKKAKTFGRAFGVAFQIQDDLMDKSGSAKAADTATLTKILEQQIGVAKASAEQLLNHRLMIGLIDATFS